jgi:pyruvate dehydrogenase E2 component (dihydrolipoamide acetyltransferase)
MTTVIMPKMGDAMEEGTLLEWVKKEGEPVKSGEIIGTIQTDKATLELESPGTGVLKGVLVGAGETVPVGQPIAAIVSNGEQLPSNWGKGGAQAAPATQEAPKPISPDAPIQQQQEAVAEPSVPQGAQTEAGATPPTPRIEAEAHRPHGLATPDEPIVSEGRVKASPLARRVARDLGVDVATVAGSGPGGRVVEKDIRAAAERAPAAAPAPQKTAPETRQEKAPEWSMPAPLPKEGRTIQLNKLRQITAKVTGQSKQQVPHFYVTVEVDLERLMSLREMFEDDGSKVSINDFVMRACALALREMPIVNSSFQGQTLKQNGAINIGMAVALDEGLTLPVIHDADHLSIREISQRAKELAKKARDNRLGLDELSDPTFSISNMGMLDVDEFSAIIVQPNAAILAISSARKKVVVSDEEEDTVEIRWRMNITGSFDHRVVDGAVGARFMNTVKAYLENPTRLL